MIFAYLFGGLPLAIIAIMLIAGICNGIATARRNRKSPPPP